MPKQFTLSPIAQAIALALNAGITGMVPTSAQADLTTVQTVPVTVSASRVSTIDFGNKLKQGVVNSLPGTGQLPLFPPSLGVLTGVQIDLAASTLTQAMQFDAQWLTQSPGSQMAVTDSVQPLISISTPTVSNLQNLVGPSSPMGLICDAYPTLLCQETLTLASNADFTAPASDPNALDPYVGETGTMTGTVNANFSPLQLTPPEIGTLSSATLTENAHLDGQLNVTYSYLNHAQPAFVPGNTQTTILNFGTVLQGNNLPAQQWGVTNAGAAPNVGLDFIRPTGSYPKLDFGITQPFIVLDTGTTLLYNATLDTAQPGSANTSYPLVFNDSHFKGTTSTRKAYQMTLNVTGNVAVRPASLKASPLVTGFHPAAPVSADFNRDGKLDMLVLDRDHASIVAYKGDAKARLTNVFQAKVGLNPVALAVGNLNNDGNPDAVVANFGDHNVSVLLGQGGFKFQVLTAVAAGNGPIDVALNDLNRDGKLDLVVADISDNTVRVMLGNGLGKFSAGKAFPAGSSPYGLAIGDLNLDGKPDVVVTNAASNQVAVLLGNGNGLLQAPLSFAVGLSPLALTIADVGGDGKPDLVTANHGGNNLSVLRGTGTKLLFAPATSVALTAGSGPSKLMTADINKDGHPDLVVANNSLNSVSVLANKGKGTFAMPVNVAVGAQPGGIAVADINADSKPDVIVANTADTSLGVALNTTVVAPSGKFVGRSDSQIPTLIDDAKPMVMGDFNRDGLNDLVITRPASFDLVVYQGSGDGRFQSITAYQLNFRPNSVATGDINGDGKLDLVVTGYDQRGVMLGLGNGLFQAIKAIGRTSGLHYNFGTLGDVNRDGKPDFVAESLYGEALEVSLGIGDGKFQTPKTYVTGSLPNLANFASVAMGDINGDGKPDLAATTDNAVSVLLGNGDGSFQAGKLFPIGPSGLLQANASLALADLNSDGKLDLAVANNGTDTIEGLIGIGDGNFQKHFAYAIGVGSNKLSVGDINGDSKPDIVFINNFAFANNLGVLIGNGIGSFQPVPPYPLVGLPISVMLGEVNGDSRPDVVVATDNSVSILLNRAP